ncbi:ThiF family adenylyltransferase [Sphingomonas sp. MMSM20]|uniref:ThiF family adenylyltransferase n=1 Tax=Sphingomonas lycopersici TaxID=2951807 RepID=UPI00223889C5|nr:ThiF family adenylyltransferase [Sphingomonas lycopersici]MCW6531955.1 ThiF family adenylyltransferase [Sphingomonas lycopersici]
MTVTLVLADTVADALSEAASDPLEVAGVLLAAVHQGPDGDIRLLVRQHVMVSQDAYRKRARDHMVIAPEGYVPALGEAEALGAMAIWFHTHPGTTGTPLPSLADAEVDRAIADLFRLRSGSPYYGTLILSPRESGFAFSGTLQPEGGHSPARAIDRLWIVGDRWRLVSAIKADDRPPSPIFDRNVRAFGGDVQRALSDLKIAVSGCGGTGSAVAEQLVRLGVRNLLLIDADRLSGSNVTRVYGSTAADVGRPKAEVLRDHLIAIAPDLHCEAIDAMVTLEPIARRLGDRDLVFGCTDDNAGRLVLSRLATYLLTPVIDIGVLLSSDASGMLTGIDGRVTVLSPGSACLVCRDRIDLARAAAEAMTPTERKRLADEGYVPALAGTEPAVVAFTTAVAAAAVGEMLERLIGYGPDPRPSEILLRIHEREISTNRAAPRPGHYCDPASKKLGAATADPFLEQVWPKI